MDARAPRHSSLFGYLLGSVRSHPRREAFDRDVDLRKAGSGNIGATNVARTLGGRRILTLALDAGKGSSPSRSPGSPDQSATTGSPWSAAVFLGHYLPSISGSRWQGRRGRPGVVLFLSPETAFVLVSLAAVLYFTRYVSLASLCRRRPSRRHGVLGSRGITSPSPSVMSFLVIYTPGRTSTASSPPGEQVRRTPGV